MVTISEHNKNEEAILLYDKAYKLHGEVLRLLNIARETKYSDDIEILQSYPELVKAISKVQKLQAYVAETIGYIQKYERISFARINDRPTRSTQGRKKSARITFSEFDILDSD